MIANFFNKSKPAVHLSVALLLFVYYVVAVLLFSEETFSFLFLIEKVGVFLLLLVLLFIVKFIVSKNNLTQDNSYTVLLIVFLLGTFYESMLTPLLALVNIVLLLSYRKLYSLKSTISTQQKLFDAGLWVGVAVLLFNWSILFLGLVYVAMIIHHKVNFKNLWVPIAGFAAPIVIYFTYCFALDEMVSFHERWIFVTDFNFVPYNQFKLLIPITFLITLLLWAIVILTPRLTTIGINPKRSWTLVLSHLFIAVIMIVLVPNKNGSEVFFMFFPIAGIVTNFLQRSPSENFKNLILYLFLGISVLVYFL